MQEKQCSFIKENGEQCGAAAMKGSVYCFVHNPDIEVERHMALVRGGMASKKIELKLEPLSIKDPSEVATLLESTINGVRSGEIPPNIANTVGYLASHILKALEASNLNQRVEMVESVLLERKRSVSKH